MVQKYVVADLIVDAVQWTGYNAEEVTNFVGKPTFVSLGRRLVICLNNEQDDVISAHVGDYVVKGSNFNLRVISKKVFEDAYCIVNSSSIVVPEITQRKIDRTRACDICGKHNKIVLIFNDKCYCKDCYKDVCYGTEM